METAIKTYRYRVKDKHAAALNRMADAVNFVWNFCNDTQRHALKWRKKFPGAYELSALTAGSSQHLGISADSISEVCRRYVGERKKSRKTTLRYRGKKTLGWLPLRGANNVMIDGRFRYYGSLYCLWHSRALPTNAKILDRSSFSQNSQGKWFLNLVIECPVTQASLDNQPVGIDLGLKDFVALSTGEKIAAPRIYRSTQAALAKAQRARKKRQVKKIHVKIANQRHDFLHKISTRLTREYGHIVVGNVSASKLVKTRMAKSVLDAGWSDFRNMLSYKAIARCGRYVEVNEAYTTQACSDCGSISGPKGRKGLAIREWQCGDCGAVHDRDHNAAIVILRRGHATPVAGAASSGDAKPRHAGQLH